MPCGPPMPIYTTGHTHQRCSTTRVPCGRGCCCTCHCLCCPMPGVRDLEVHVVPASPLAAAETIGAMPRVPVTVLSIGWKSTGVLRSQNKSTLNWLSRSKRKKSIVKIFLYIIIFFYCMECYTVTEKNIFFQYCFSFWHETWSGSKAYGILDQHTKCCPHSFMSSCYPWPSLPSTLSSLGQFSYC